MMARMPELSSRLTSPTVKPSRLSISSCDRTRSPEFLLPKSRLPSSTMAAHCSAMLSESSLAAASSAAAAGSSESSDASHWAAIASWSIWSLPAMIFKSVPSLNHDFLEQHRADLLRRHGVVEALGQLFLEAKQPGRAVEVGGPQFAQVGLEQVGDARQVGLDGLDLLLFLDLEHDLDAEILHALARRADQIDHHVGHFEERRRLLRRRFGVLLLAMAAHHEEPGAAAGAEDGREAPHRDEKLDLALFRRCGFAVGRAFCLLVISHCPARFQSGMNA